MHYLTQHSTFATTQALNDALYTYINRHYYDMNETDRAVLKQLGRYAVKYKGAAQLKADTLAGLIGKSTKTIRRSIAKLVALNIVEKRKTLRPVNGGYGANIIVILPVAETAQLSLFANDVQSGVSTRKTTEEPTVSKPEAAESADESITLLKRKEKPKSTKDTVNRVHNENSGDKISEDPTPSNDVPAAALKDSIPAPIYEAITRYFSKAADVYNYYGILLRAKASVTSGLLIEESPQSFTDAWDRAIFAWKSGRVRKSFDALLYTVFQQATVDALRARGKDRFNATTAWLFAE